MVLKERKEGQTEMPVRLVSLKTGESGYFMDLRAAFRWITDGREDTPWYIRTPLEIGIKGTPDIILSPAESGEDGAFNSGPFWVDASDHQGAYLKSIILGSHGLSPEDLLARYTRLQRRAMCSFRDMINR